MTNSEWASWVQAIGSIAAILAAFLVGRLQSKVALRAVLDQRYLTELEAAKTALTLGLAMAETFTSVCEYVSIDQPHMEEFVKHPVRAFEVDQIRYLPDSIDRLDLNLQPMSCVLFVTLLASHSRRFRQILFPARAEPNIEFEYTLMVDDLSVLRNRVTETVNALQAKILEMDRQRLSRN